MISPSDGSTVSAALTTFNLSAGAGVTAYYVWIGTTPAAYNMENMEVPA